MWILFNLMEDVGPFESDIILKILSTREKKRGKFCV